MLNNMIVHETVIRDIIDLATGIKDSDEVQTVKNYTSGTSFKSITSKSEALTLVFPVITSKNCSYETAAMISKAIERKAVSMLHMLFAASNITNAVDGVDYLSRFHTNLKTGGAMTVDNFIDTMDALVEESGLLTEASQIENYEAVKRDFRNLNFYLEDSTNEQDCLQDYKIVHTESGDILVHEADKRDPEEVYRDIRNAARVNITARNDANAAYAKLKDLEDKRQNNLDTTIKQTTIRKNDVSIEKTKDDLITAMSNRAKNRTEMEGKRLLDTDVKKANELVPTMMVVNFTSIHNDKYPVEATMVIGIKAKLYAVDSEDILNRIKIKHSDSNLMLNLVKVSTREISFFKDFIFALDRAKIDALSQSRRGSSSKIWKILERRALKSKMRRSFFMTNDATAISTLVLSQEDVDYLRKTEYIDVEDPRVIRPILEAYNLMGFVIVDESLEIAKFIFDTGDDLYEILTFTNLEREQKDNSKKIINLMSKMNR